MLCFIILLLNKINQICKGNSQIKSEKTNIAIATLRKFDGDNNNDFAFCGTQYYFDRLYCVMLTRIYYHFGIITLDAEKLF